MIRALLYAHLIAATFSWAESRQASSTEYSRVQFEIMASYKAKTACNFSIDQWPNASNRDAWHFLASLANNDLDDLLSNFSIREHTCQAENLFSFLLKGKERLQIKSQLINHRGCQPNSQIYKDESWPRMNDTASWSTIEYTYSLVRVHRPFYPLIGMLSCSLRGRSGKLITVAESLNRYFALINKFSENYIRFE